MTSYETELARLGRHADAQAVRSLLDAAATDPDYWPHMAERFVADLITDALPSTWLRRADMFEWARPKPTDWPGHATADQLAEADRRNAVQAAQCRLHAALLGNIPLAVIAASRDAQLVTSDYLPEAVNDHDQLAA